MDDEGRDWWGTLLILTIGVIVLVVGVELGMLDHELDKTFELMGGLAR